MAKTIFQSDRANTKAAAVAVAASALRRETAEQTKSAAMCRDDPAVAVAVPALDTTHLVYTCKTQIIFPYRFYVDQVFFSIYYSIFSLRIFLFIYLYC